MGWKVRDLSGQTFGALTAIAPDGKDKHGNTLWLCICTCGDQKRALYTELNRGLIHSCGCRQTGRSKGTDDDLTGQLFGRLTATSREGSTKRGVVLWRCKCECGNECVSAGADLKRLNTTSCGCYQREQVRKMRSKPAGVHAWNTAVGRYRRNARERGYEWALPDDIAISLMKQDCFYCAQPPSEDTSALKMRKSQSKIMGFRFYEDDAKKNLIIYRNGLDRKDNSKGYTIDNVVPCCKGCNYFKRDRSTEDFLELISKIYLHRVKTQEGNETT